MLRAAMLNVLLTNDDGIEADGLQAMRRALVAMDDVNLAVIAPDGNRSAMARSITTRRPLWVEEVPFADGTKGYATDGTPVDCLHVHGHAEMEDSKILEKAIWADYLPPAPPPAVLVENQA